MWSEETNVYVEWSEDYLHYNWTEDDCSSTFYADGSESTEECGDDVSTTYTEAVDWVWETYGEEQIECEEDEEDDWRWSCWMWSGEETRVWIEWNEDYLHYNWTGDDCNSTFYADGSDPDIYEECEELSEE